MSLYSFGKLICGAERSSFMEAEVSKSARSAGFVVAWDAVDDGDKATLDEVSCLSSYGRYYAIYASEKDTDATDLWIEVSVLGVKSRLMHAVALLVSDPTIVAGGIALVDGGVEEVVVVAPPELPQIVLRDSRVPWDRGPNRLYVWSK